MVSKRHCLTDLCYGLMFSSRLFFVFIQLDLNERNNVTRLHATKIDILQVNSREAGDEQKLKCPDLM